MPLINEYKSKKLSNFKKKAYRPWDLQFDKNIDLLNNTPKIDFTDQNDLISDEISKKQLDSTFDELGNKKETKKKQLGNIKDTNKETIRKQLGNVKETIRKQLGNNFDELGNIKETIRKRKGNIKETIRKQLGNNFDELGNIKETSKREFINPLPDSMRRLCGLQRKILFFIVNRCILRGQLSTGPITNETLRDIEKSNVDTIKTSLYRLTEKGWIFRDKGKRGRGGFVSFKITENTRNIILEEIKNLNFSEQLNNNLNELGNNKETIRKQLGNIKDTNKETEAPCSSSKLYKTTTNALSQIYLPEEWSEIDIKPLEDIKFTRLHLEQIFKYNMLEPHIVQDSIYAFAFDLQYNNKSEKLTLSPLNVFMGIMKKGNPYLPPDNYESPGNRAMRKYLENKKNEESKRIKQEEEAFDYAYKEWKSSIPLNELDNFVDQKYRKEREGPIYNSLLIDYFKKNLWTEIKSKITNLY